MRRRAEIEARIARMTVAANYVMQVSNAKEFAIQKFCKDITPVADILEARFRVHRIHRGDVPQIALSTVPVAELAQPGNAQLKTLFEGVEGFVASLLMTA